MVYGVDNRDMIDMKKEIEKAFKEVTVTITKDRRTPNGYGDLSIRYSSTEKSAFGVDSGNFNLCSVPNNCGLIWMGGVNIRVVKKRCLKFEIVEMMTKYFGHSGIILSQVDTGHRTNFWKIYEQYGFRCVVQDRGIIHNGNKDLRIYYKPLNEKNKINRGGPSWETPVGLIEEKDLKNYNTK